jgi:arginine/lysine/ornithine decarboxylase
MMESEYISPLVALSPQDAFYAEKISLPLTQCAGRVCAEFVMSYPPGIPILAPGELVTEEVIAYIRYAMDKGCTMTGPESMDVSRLNVLKGA